VGGILRAYGGDTKNSNHGCTCQGAEEHRDFVYFCQNVLTPQLRGEKVDISTIKVCWNTVNIFEHKLPKKLTKSDSRLYLSDVTSVKEYERILRGTYWYKAYAQDAQRRNRFLSLLAGQRGPTKELLKMEVGISGHGRVKQVVNTVDGAIHQLVLAFPDKEHVCNWSFIDRTRRGLTACLVTDYEMPADKQRTTTFATLKSLRKEIKRYGFHENLTPAQCVQVPRAVNCYGRAVKELNDKSLKTMYRIAILTQTRASGTPPPSVFTQTYSKYKEVLTRKVSPPSAGVTRAVVRSVKAVYDRLSMSKDIKAILKDALGRAKISLSNSAELSTPHKDGGKYEAFRALVNSMPESVYYMDLNTGSVTGTLIPEHKEYIGTRVFHHTLRELKEGKYPDILTVRAVPVPEMGKVRMITVSYIVHAVLLHPIAHVLLEILESIPSQKAGVSAANHAFELYKRLSHGNPSSGFIFGDKDIFALSSDLETATDYMNPYIARIFLSVFLGPSCCGLPPFYTEVILRLLTLPRKVYYERERDEFTSTCAVLMGDPVTKFVLHMTQLVSQQMAYNFIN